MDDIDPFKVDPDDDDDVKPVAAPPAAPRTPSPPLKVDHHDEDEDRLDDEPLGQRQQQQRSPQQQEGEASTSPRSSPGQRASPRVQTTPRLKDDPDKKDLIQIVDALKTSEGSTAAYIAYVIRSEHGDARRRYSEFEALRGVLSKLYPVLIIPPIPPHHSLGDYAVKQSKAKEDANVIARRRRMLTVFLNRCNRHPLLGKDRVFHRFLDPSTTWSEITHSAPVTLLPKNILKAPSHDPTDTSLAAFYSSLPSPSTTQPLAEPDNRFLDSEAFTSKFSSHLSGSMEKINRRLMKRWSELGADHAELGGLLNGFGLTEGHRELAAAIERTGQAVDNVYVHTNAMLQDWERTFTEPLAEYSQFSSIIKSLLKYRHNKHLQYELAREVLETKRINLEELERTEAEARRLDSALDRASRRTKPQSDADAAAPAPRGDEDDGDVSHVRPENASLPEPAGYSVTSSTAPPTARRSPMTGSGLISALSHTFHGIIDTDPEATRRNTIGKTRDAIEQLQEAERLTLADVRYASQTIQSDLDRFQRQKVSDLREMCLSYARFHREWAAKNLEQWEGAKAEIAKLSEEALLS